MIVVSDTSPLHYLVLIDCEEVLPELFGMVIIPEAVARELESGGAPEKIRKWLASEPKWLERRTIGTVDPALDRLDRGEAEVLALGQELQADLVLMDEGAEGSEAARAPGGRDPGRPGAGSDAGDGAVAGSAGTAAADDVPRFAEGTPVVC